MTRLGSHIEAHCGGSTPPSDTVVEGEVADSSDVIPWKSVCFNMVLLFFWPMGLHGVVARLSRGISMGSLPILVAKYSRDGFDSRWDCQIILVSVVLR